MAHQLALDVYVTTADFPKSETFGLRSQMRRAAVSICANIAEGCGRGTDLDFRRFLLMAMGSACELESEILLSADLAYVPSQSQANLLARVQRVKRLLIGLIKNLTVAICRARLRRQANGRILQGPPATTGATESSKA
jgi:four helix bundle protein